MTRSSSPSLESKALACQKAEHDYAGMPCGIMDQVRQLEQGLVYGTEVTEQVLNDKVLDANGGTTQ